nr:hypothetical protein GCM10020092_035000 [Actinoplanes digitatis]
MLSALLGLIAVAEIGLLFLVIALRRRRPDWALSMLILVIMALIWDNAVIAVGGTLGEGEPLRTLSVPRYVTHALLVPLLIMVGVGLGRRHGIRTLAGRTAPAAFGALTVALVAAGLWLDVLTLELEPTRYADTVRYTNAASHGAPIPAVVTVLVLIGIGTALLVRARSAVAARRVGRHVRRGRGRSGGVLDRQRRRTAADPQCLVDGRTHRTGEGTRRRGPAHLTVIEFSGRSSPTRRRPLSLRSSWGASGS